MSNFVDFKSIQGLLLMHYQASLTKLDVHYIVTVIHIKNNFCRIPFSGYLAMASDGRTRRRTGGRTDGRTLTKLIPPPRLGIITTSLSFK